MQLKSSSMVYRLAFLGIAAGFVAVAAIHDDAIDFPYIDFDNPAIQYETGAGDNAVTRLEKKIADGKVKLEYDPQHGYLPSLLKALNVNPDSQMLVFSKTSFQGPKISPQSPRALYFNDDVAVGFVPKGDVYEFAATDPLRGIIFYTMDMDKTAKPEFFRHKSDCLQCHMMPGTLNVAGLTITSVIPAPDGSPRFAAAATIVDSRTPLPDRWGGWYVTGTAGDLQSRANAVAPRPDQPGVLDYHNTQNLTSLAGRVDTRPYLEPTSDMVALLVIEHQTRITNLITRAGWEARTAVQEGKVEEFKKNRLDLVVDQIASYMLFSGEAKIFDPIQGVSTFTKTFPERGPRDSKGRGLRDFDLQKRLFKYPLSYMIYSQEFDAMPDLVKDAVYQKIYDVLTGKDSGPEYSNLSSDDRRAILEIVRETKSNLPAYWKQNAINAAF